MAAKIVSVSNSPAPTCTSRSASISVRCRMAMPDHSMPMTNRPRTAVLRRSAISFGRWRICNIILQGIVNLEHKGLVAPHQREPVPAVLGIVGDRIGLAHAIGIAALRYHEVLRRHAARIADGEWKGLDRVADRTPHLYDREPPFQELVGFLRQQTAHPLRPRPFR